MVVADSSKVQEKLNRYLEETYSPHTYVKGHHPNQYVKGQGKPAVTVVSNKIDVGEALKDIDAADTSEMVARKLGDNWANYGLKVDFLDFKPETAKSLAKAAIAFQDKYPEAAKYLHYYGRAIDVDDDRSMYNLSKENVQNSDFLKALVASSTSARGVGAYAAFAQRSDQAAIAFNPYRFNYPAAL